MTARLMVVVPMFNSAGTVERTLHSVMAQTFTDWRCVVVNDGSTDNGPALVEALAAGDGRIRMVSQDNRGLAGARNTGLREALREGIPYVHFLDADDWMSPDAYERLLEGAEETGAAYGGYELCDPNGRSLGRQSPMSAPMVGLDEQLEWNRAATHAMVLRTDLLRDEQFDESLPVVEDYDLWLRLATRGVRWKGVERIVCGYRLRPDSLSKKFAAMCATYQMVVRRAVNGAAAAGWAGRGVDLSARRVARVLGNMAMCYATMDAIVDPLPNKARATGLLVGSVHSGRFSAAEAAQAASTALLFGACTAPEIDGWSERRWLTPLRQWWVRCAEEGWMEYEDVDIALIELSRKVVHPDEVAESMLDAADGGETAGEHGVVVAGIDRAGRRLARRGAARGWRVLVADDWSDRREAECLEPIPGVRVVRTAQEMNAAGGEFAGANWVAGMIDERGDGSAARIARAAEQMGVRPTQIERWDDHRQRLGARNLLRMREALRVPRARAG